MKLAIIAAIGKNRVIGKDGKIPWHISEDLKRFKRLTTGNTVLMGRKTWESLGKPLSNRRNIVVTSRPVEGAECYATISAALKVLNDQERVFVIGGAQVYTELLPRADELFLTFVDQQVEGDTYFPPYEDLLKRQFRIVRSEKHPGFEFADFVRSG